ncbi:hypothetical protein [Cognatilysobacter bugurensis]|uniref:Uncharacterized protein n=1 Tax=Cognatilysobacter bugurensis TaxID=543356 RepID=A0A918SSK0_9GAMM|nr:hypothetical protein [Lysobacter bugurensis]GHA69112.1 hypothetical protein GCM10007067_01280 [Lysobacter bugurensis]
MPDSTRHCTRHPAAVLLALASAMGLPGCVAMGELAHHGPWAWLAIVVVVLALVGFIVSRMRR